jgi:TonB family protein
LINIGIIYIIISGVNNNHKIVTNIPSGISIGTVNLSLERNKPKKIQKKKTVISKKAVFQKNIDNKIETSEQDYKISKIPTINNSKVLGNRPSPHYPRRSIMLKQEGKVVLKALVGKQGKVLQVEIVSSSGFKLLDNSAQSAIKKWKFDIKEQKKTKMVWIKIPVEFMIS